MEEEIDLIGLIEYFWKKKVWIIVVGIICVILAIIYTKLLITPEYTAKSQFILTNHVFETEADVYSYAKLPDRYYAIADSKMVLDKVIENLKLEVEDVLEFKEENIEITHSPSSYLITVSVNTDDAKKSAQIANEIVKVTIEEIKKTYEDSDIQILDYAVENWEPVNIDLLGNIIKIVFVGEIILCAYIVIVYVFVDKKNKKAKK